MVTIIKTGAYEIVETKQHARVLHLDDAIFLWAHPKNKGDMLMACVDDHSAREIVSSGDYCLYKVEGEILPASMHHLDLETTSGGLQGYLLPSGLPTKTYTRKRIIPTNQVTTGKKSFIRHFFSRKSLPRIPAPQLWMQKLQTSL